MTEILNKEPVIGSMFIKYEPAVEPGRAQEKKFRIYAKRLFLTYSRTNLTPLEVLNQLQAKFQNLKYYAISQEEHADEPEKGKHIHAFIECDKKVNILSHSFLDLTESCGTEKKNLHGEYQAVKNKKHVIAYVKKDGNYISNIETENEFKIKLFLIAKEKGLEEAMNYLSMKRPELVCTHYKKIESNLKAFLESSSLKLPLKFTDFDYPKEINHWFEFEKDTRTLFLTGPSGAGKTEGVINLLKDYNPILITDINALKELKSSHKAIIFDDINWSVIPREVKIHLLDKNRTSNIKIIYQSVKLPSTLVKAVTSNNPQDLLSFWDNDDAITRRIRHVHLEQPLFNQINHINNLTINFINKNNKEENNKEENNNAIHSI